VLAGCHEVLKDCGCLKAGTARAGGKGARDFLAIGVSSPFVRRKDKINHFNLYIHIYIALLIDQVKQNGIIYIVLSGKGK